MVCINNNWYPVETLDDISKIVRENFNEELADVIDQLIPEYSDDDYRDLQMDLDHKEDEIDELEIEIDNLERKIEELEDQIDELDGE